MRQLLRSSTATIDSKGRKRPRDPNQLAKLIVDIASGEVEDTDYTTSEGLGHR